jgi:hypothetical protein
MHGILDLLCFDDLTGADPGGTKTPVSTPPQETRGEAIAFLLNHA